MSIQVDRKDSSLYLLFVGEVALFERNGLCKRQSTGEVSELLLPATSLARSLAVLTRYAQFSSRAPPPCQNVLYLVYLVYYT